MGFLSIDIGCGRRRREDAIDPAAAFSSEKNGRRPGRAEARALAIALPRASATAPRPGIERELAALFEIGPEAAFPPPLLVEKL
jgi:hypothetical protein